MNLALCLAVPTVIFVRTSREMMVYPRRYYRSPPRVGVERTGNEIAHENAFYSVHRECLLAFYAFIPYLLPLVPRPPTNLIDRVPFFLLLLLLLLVHSPPLESNDFSKARDSPTIFIVLYRRWKTRAITGTTTPDASSCPRSRRFSGPECRASFAGHLCSFSTGIPWWTAPSSCHRGSTRPPVQR